MRERGLVEHYLYFRTEEAARSAAAEIAAHRFVPEVTQFAPDSWRLIARRSGPIESLLADSDELERIAQSHGGEYDGIERTRVYATQASSVITRPGASHRESGPN